MPTTLEPPPVARIDRQLSQAAGRIRTTDVLTGLLAIVVLTLAYAAGMILLDRYFGLPGFVRQVGFVGWLGLVGYSTYRLMVIPFGRIVNPLYVAKQVESAIPDAKNVVVNYVDLKDAKLPESVRSAVAGRASAEVTDADVHKAGESKRLVQLGIAAAVLAVFLAVLFLVFSPAQFNSLVNRTFRPFAVTQIVSKTRLAITYPNDPNLSVTSGQPIVLQVSVDGRLPSADGDDRIRLMIRHNPEDPAYEAVPFEAGGTNREFQIKVPEYLIQNGFWYKVAGGDGETAEYRATVRPRPLVLGFQVTYEYPEYLRMPKETLDRPQIEAFRGTKVTVTAKTNRPLQSGRMSFDGKTNVEPGSVVPDDAESIRYSFTVTESGAYRLFFTTADGEPNTDPPVYPIKVIADNPPAVVIVKPEPDEISLPLNGRLEIDAVATDDIGLAKLAIRTRLVGTVPTPLLEKVYGVKLKREEDGSFPTRVEMKDSIAIAELKADSGAALTLKEGDTIEYWVEATDNCTYEKAGVGISAMKRVKLLTPVTQPEPKKEQEKKAEERKNEEKKQGEQQQKKFEKEQRPPPPGQAEKQPKTDEQPKESDQNPMDGGEKPPEGNNQPKSQDPKSGEKSNPSEQPMPGGEKPPEGNNQPKSQDPKAGEKSNPSEQPMPGGEKPPEGGNQSKPSPESKSNDKSDATPGGTGEGKPSPVEQKKNEEIQRKAEQVSNEIKNQKSGENGNPQPGSQSGQPTKEQIDEFKKAAKDAQSNDPATKKAGEDKLDQMMGKDARQQAQKDAEQLKKDLNSKDEKTRQAAQDKVEKMAEQLSKDGSPQSAGQDPPKPTKEQIEEFKKAAKDAKSDDPATKKAGEDKLDQMMGKDARQKAQKEAEHLKKDLNSSDEKTKQAAEEKVKEMADKMAKQQGEGGSGSKQEAGNAQAGKPPTPEQVKEMTEAAKDLTSNDPAKKEAAQKKLDNMVGEKNRKEAEKLANDLKSDDQKTKQAAEEKVKEMANQQAGSGSGQEAGKTPTAEQKEVEAKAKAEQKKDAADAIKNLGSDNAEDKKAAQEQLDKSIGPDNRKAAEELQKDLKSNNPSVRKDAEKKAEELANKADEKPGQGDDKGLSPEDAKKLADKAKDLGSKDEKTRKDAEKEFDDKVGKENREKLQQAMNDLNSGDPEKMKDAAKQVEEWKKQAEEGNPNGGRKSDQWKPGGFGGGEKGGDPLKDNPADRLKTAELQLKSFKENRDNKALREKLGYTQEEYDRFVEGFNKIVEQKRIEVTAKANPAAPPKAINVNQGAEKIGARGTESGPKSSSAGTAPPGYSDASKKFAEEAAKKKGGNP